MDENSDCDEYIYWPDVAEINSSSSSSDILSIDDNLSLTESLEDISSSSLNEDDGNPTWFRDQLKTKVCQTKTRLTDLSNYVINNCDDFTRKYLNRIEADHNTPFCKLELPLYIPITRPWNNAWKFNCIQKCKLNEPPIDHFHSVACLEYEFEHYDTDIKRCTLNNLECVYPTFIWDIVKTFETFIKNYFLFAKKEPNLDEINASKPCWNTLLFRSNSNNEVLVSIVGNFIPSMIKYMTNYFENNCTAKKLKIVSIYFIISRCLTNHVPVPKILFGESKMIDTVGSIKLEYDYKTPFQINTIQTELWVKAILNLLHLSTPKTSVLILDDSPGIMSNMLAPNFQDVIVLCNSKEEIQKSEEISLYNKINNVSFFECKSFLWSFIVDTEVENLVKNKVSIIIISQNSLYGNDETLMKALKKIPSILKVLVIGSFTKKFYKSISTLMCNDDKIGDPFLPTQGCIIDKSPILLDAFETIILFEKKISIELPLDFDLLPTVDIQYDKMKVNKKNKQDSENDSLLKNNNSLYEAMIDGELYNETATIQNDLPKEGKNLSDLSKLVKQIKKTKKLEKNNDKGRENLKISEFNLNVYKSYFDSSRQDVLKVALPDEVEKSDHMSKQTCIEKETTKTKNDLLEGDENLSDTKANANKLGKTSDHVPKQTCIEKDIKKIQNDLLEDDKNLSDRETNTNELEKSNDKERENLEISGLNLNVCKSYFDSSYQDVRKKVLNNEGETSNHTFKQACIIKENETEFKNKKTENVILDTKYKSKENTSQFSSDSELFSITELHKDRQNTTSLTNETFQKQKKILDIEIIKDLKSVSENEILKEYKNQLEKKVYETKTRLSDLSKTIKASCKSTETYLNKIEADHSTSFCEIDFIHQPLNKTWKNCWVFKCIEEFKLDNNAKYPIDSSDHIEYKFTESNDNNTLPKVEDKTKFSDVLYPKFIRNIIEVFEDFMNTLKKNSKESDKFIQEKPKWDSLILRSNYKNEVLAQIRGRNIFLFSKTMKNYFEYNSTAKNLKILSIYFVSEDPRIEHNSVISCKKYRDRSSLLFGNPDLEDIVKHIKVVYNLQTPSCINALETKFLCENILSLLNPTHKTSILVMKTRLRIITNILAKYCDKVIGVTELKREIIEAKKISKFNNIKNTFYTKSMNESQIPFFMKQNTELFVLLWQDSKYGNDDNIMRILRKIPIIKKIVIFGSFLKNFKKSILSLVTQDANTGDPFLPVQGYIVDKSPILIDEFDIIILFERKASIGIPKIKNSGFFDKEIEAVHQKIISNNIDQSLLNESTQCLYENKTLDDQIFNECTQLAKNDNKESNVKTNDTNETKSVNSPKVTEKNHYEKVKYKEIENSSSSNSNVSTKEVINVENSKINSFNTLKVLDTVAINSKYANTSNTNSSNEENANTINSKSADVLCITIDDSSVAHEQNIMQNKNSNTSRKRRKRGRNKKNKKKFKYEIQGTPEIQNEVDFGININFTSHPFTESLQR